MDRAHILLHEPHAKPDLATCVSSRKTLNASRAILELMYVLAATNYDVSLLDLQAFVRDLYRYLSGEEELMSGCAVDVLVYGWSCPCAIPACGD